MAPGQTASVAGVAAAQGLDVPIAGQQPGLRARPAAGPDGRLAEEEPLRRLAGGAVRQAADLLKAYQAAYPDVTPSLGVLVGTGMATLMNQVLDEACDNGDLTREGVLDGFKDLKDVDTGGLVVPIRGFENGKSPEPGELRAPAGRRPRRRQGPRRTRPRASSPPRSPADPGAAARTAPPPARGGAPLLPSYSRPAPGDGQQAQRQHGR